MIARQQGYITAAIAGFRFIISESAKLPKFALILLSSKVHFNSTTPRISWIQSLDSISTDGVELKTYSIDINAFYAHLSACHYPKNYAGGPISQGGWREQKALEYFISLDLLNVQSTDVVIDVASEWSIFPDSLRNLTDATVYQQDLIYPPGINNYRIGGNADHMPIPDEYANKLVLHNAFEHFEGNADTNFINEAWRILKPGGILCILPLFITETHSIITDPLVNRQGIVYDEKARIIEILWWHNRFGRFYDINALRQRVLIPGYKFNIRIYQVVNLKELNPSLYLHFALVMQKPT